MGANFKLENSNASSGEVTTSTDTDTEPKGFAYSPQTPIQRPVLDGFRQVINLDLWRSGQVRDGPGYFQDPIIRTGAEIQVCHSLLEQFHARRIQRAIFAQQPRCHPSITGYSNLFAKTF